MLRAQFTYTASSKAGVWEKGAGWKIQSVTGAPGLDPVPEDIIRRAARTVGGFVPPTLPELPTQADVDALPRRLRLDLLGGNLACLSHVVAAGPDYSGRPNFFAHGLVLALGDEADGGGFLRPADLWGADFWLRPFGSEAVESSSPDGGLADLRRGPLDEAALERFTRDHPNQRDLVLAAFERYVGGGGPLVVVGESPESVVQWLRLVGLLLSPGTAWRLPFSTYERLRDTATPMGVPFAMVGVPAADAVTAAALPGQRFAVLRDEQAPVRAGLGRWKLQDGAELVAGTWAQLAETVVMAGLLPDVTDRIDELSIECGDSTFDEPLWVLGAAVLLVDDLPMEDLARDAAELVLAHWPRGLVLGRRTTKLLLGRLVERVPPSRVAQELAGRSGGARGSLATQLMLLGPIQEALAAPTDFERLGSALPASLPALLPAAAGELDGMLGEALGWVPLAGAVGRRALLSIAALMDWLPNSEAHRARAADLARTLLVPALLDPDTDPERLGWPPLPVWLWQELTPSLAATFDLGRHEPGRALSAATHRWLGELAFPRGELTTPALRETGPVEWERAAYRVFRAGPRPTDITPLERAAAFLATVHSSAVNEGRAEDLWAVVAAEDSYPREQLDLATALVLMECLPPHIPFVSVLVAVLRRTAPTSDTAAAVARLREREPVPDWAEEELARHDEAAAGNAVLVTGKADVVPLTDQARRLDWGPAAWIGVAEALLRVDVTALPVRDLASFTWDRAMPWEQGWELLLQRHTDPDVRLLLAAHLVCRGTRATVHPGEDQAAGWLVSPDEHAVARSERAAAALLAGLDLAGDLVRRVEQLTDAAPARPRPLSAAAAYGLGEEDPDHTWRTEAGAAARRVVKRSSPAANRSRVPRWRARADQP